ncbi:MAG: flagellin-like protein [Lachnospiraceae bacterium]|nr:flagellin-like protein [Lachnospiraceae bacterium]
MSNLINFYALKAQIKLQQFFKDEEGAVDIVAIVVLIGIAVILAGIFKGGIGNLINTLLNTITGKATEAVNQM